ncbi:MAG: Rrf2 family transcriptional regulator [Candidatus Zixiibacteriota bacterium]
MLSLKAQYGLRAVVSLASHYGKGPLQAKEIATSQGVPVRYLELLLSQLRRARIVDATRGKNGGYILAKEPASITVLDVVTAFEGRVIISPMRDEKEKEGNPGSLSFIWKEAEKRVVEYLGSLNIAEVLELIQSNKEMYFI